MFGHVRTRKPMQGVHLMQRYVWTIDVLVLMASFISAVILSTTQHAELYGVLGNQWLHALIFTTTTICGLWFAGVYSTTARQERPWQFLYRLALGLVCSLALLALLHAGFARMSFDYNLSLLAAIASFFVVGTLRPILLRQTAHR